MHVLVTGGAGYVGGQLVRLLLEQGHDVRVLDALAVGDGQSALAYWGHDRYELIVQDVRDDSARRAALADVDSVVHLAAIVGDPACARDPDLARAVNLGASRALLEDAKAAGVSRFVFASTCSNYGKMDDTSAFATEEWDLRPVSLYAETKVAVELDVLAAADDGFTTTCLRFATVYGVASRMRFDLTVNEFARDAWVKRELLVYGEQFWRPYVHVRDAARGIALVLGAAASDVAGEVFNVGDSRENYRKLDLIELLVERLPDLVVERVHTAEDPRDYRVSFDKIADRLGYQITATVSDGIDEVIDVLSRGIVSDPFQPHYRN